jgi:hypothetical protein
MANRSKLQRFVGLRAAPLILAVVLMAMFLPTAQAVHDDGVFELDTPSANVTNEAAPGEDWENVCFEVTGDSDCGTNVGSAASDVAWAGDSADVGTQTSDDPSVAPAADSSSIYTGGGSKDTEDIGSWIYKNSGGLPDKDNILHAFAAKYGDNLYFGMDRWANDGDAQLGFWFFKSGVTLTDVKSGGGFKFSGAHQDGDLLILSDFSNGGTVSTIKVYKWKAGCTGNCASPNLEIVADTDAPASCAVVGANDPYCGIVNTATAPTPSEWAFKDKNGNNNAFAQGELFEGGIDLSTIAPNTCFASFLVESRSSTSPTSTLKDFVLAPEFGGCESTMSTTQTVTLEDEATVGVSGTAVWSGDVVFKLYQGGTCSVTGATGTLKYTSDDIDVSNAGGSFDPTASTSDSASGPAAIGESGSGTYWWLVTFTPDTATADKGVTPITTCEQTVISIDDTP